MSKRSKNGNGESVPNPRAPGSALAPELLNCPFVNEYCCIGSSSAKVLRVNKVIALLLLTLFSLCCKSSAADLVVSNNAIIDLFGDSLMVDSQAPSVGYRFPDFVESYFQLNYPKANIHFFNLSRSGGTMDDRLTNNIQKNGLALWAYQFNNYQHIGISSATDNGASAVIKCISRRASAFWRPR